MKSFSRHPTHGFWFSLSDGLAIAVCIATTAWGLRKLGEVAWLFPFVLGHFFLFCNIFRVPRKPELVWAGAFVVLAAGCLIADASVLHSLWLVLPITAAVLIYSIRLPTYHGIGSTNRIEDDANLLDSFLLLFQTREFFEEDIG